MKPSSFLRRLAGRLATLLGRPDPAPLVQEAYLRGCKTAWGHANASFQTPGHRLYEIAAARARTGYYSRPKPKV